MRRLAFLVGANGPEAFYRLPRLHFAASDAAKFAEAITRSEYGFIGQPAHPRAAQILITQFESLVSSASREDELLFYFAGHGWIRGGQLHLVLDDSNPSNLATTTLFWPVLQDIIKNSRARDKIVILDCCHAGQAAEDQLGGAFRGDGVVDETIRQAVRGSTANMLLACGPDGFARESERLGGGLLTTLILEALGPKRSEAVDGTGRISLQSLQNWLWSEIRRSEDYTSLSTDQPGLFTSGGPTYYIDLPQVTKQEPSDDIIPRVMSVASALRSADSSVRDSAVEELRRNAAVAAAAAPYVSELVLHRRLQIRLSAIAALAHCRTASVHPLIEALRDPVVHVREKAASALSDIGPDAVPQLVVALTNEDEHIQAGAVEALARIGGAAAEATSHLIRLIAETKFELVRQRAADALEHIGKAGASELVTMALGDGPEHFRHIARDLLGRLGVVAAPALAAVLTDRDEVKRNDAINALVRIGPTAVSFMLTAFRSPEAGVREAVVEVIRSLGPAAPTALPALCAALDDDDVNARRTATAALTVLGAAAADVVASIAEALSDPDEQVRVGAAQALAAAGPSASSTVGALELALRSPGIQTKVAVAEALGSIGLAAVAALPALVEALSYPLTKVQDAARSALRTLDNSEKSGTSLSELAAAHSDERIRNAAADALNALVSSPTGLPRHRAPLPATILFGSSAEVTSKFLEDMIGRRPGMYWVSSTNDSVKFENPHVVIPIDEEVWQNNSQCKIHVVRGDLIRSCGVLLKRRHAVDRLIILGDSGTDAGPIWNSFLNDDTVRRAIYLESAIFVIDLPHFSQTLDQSNKLVDQIAFADTIVMLRDARNELKVSSTSFERFVAVANPWATILHEPVDWQLYDKQRRRHFDVDMPSVNVSGTKEARIADNVPLPGLCAIQLVVKSILDEDRIYSWFKELCNHKDCQLIRAHAVFHFSNSRTVVTWLWRGLLDFREDETKPGCSESTLVLVGTGFDREKLQRRFESCKAE